MQVKNLDHVGIRVMNFDRAINFYEKLGFSVTRQDPEEHVVVLKHASGIEVNLLDSGNDNNQQKNVLMDVKKKYPGYTHYAIAVDSAESAKQYLESLGLSLTEGPVTSVMARHLCLFVILMQTLSNSPNCLRYNKSLQRN